MSTGLFAVSISNSALQTHSLIASSSCRCQSAPAIRSCHESSICPPFSAAQLQRAMCPHILDGKHSLSTLSCIHPITEAAHHLATSNPYPVPKHPAMRVSAHHAKWWAADLGRGPNYHHRGSLLGDLAMRALFVPTRTRAALHHMHNMRLGRASGAGFAIAVGASFVPDSCTPMIFRCKARGIPSPCPSFPIRAILFPHSECGSRTPSLDPWEGKCLRTNA